MGKGIGSGHGLGLVLAPYFYGGGSPHSALEDLVGKGVDCSGAVGFLARTAGLVGDECPDYSSGGWADACDAIAEGQQQEGDVGIYEGHVVWCLGPAYDGQKSYVLSASGGRSTTQPVGSKNGGVEGTGLDPFAYFRVETSQHYRSDFVTWGRIKASVSSSTGALVRSPVLLKVSSSLLGTVMRLLPQVGDPLDPSGVRKLTKVAGAESAQAVDYFFAAILAARAKGMV